VERYACPKVMACGVHHIGQPPPGECCGPISRVRIVAAYSRTRLAPNSNPASRSPADTAAGLEVQMPAIFSTAVEASELTAPSGAHCEPGSPFHGPGPKLGASDIGKSLLVSDRLRKAGRGVSVRGEIRLSRMDVRRRSYLVVQPPVGGLARVQLLVEIPKSSIIPAMRP
jgi:hypothetical protein